MPVFFFSFHGYLNSDQNLLEGKRSSFSSSSVGQLFNMWAVTWKICESALSVNFNSERRSNWSRAGWKAGSNCTAPCESLAFNPSYSMQEHYCNLLSSFQFKQHWSNRLLVSASLSVPSYSTVGGWWVWSGDKLHYSGCREYWLHGGAAGALWRHLPGWNLEHVHRHPSEECAKPADEHGGGPHPAGAPQNELSRWHDCRWAGLLLLNSRGRTFIFILIVIMLMSSA